MEVTRSFNHLLAISFIFGATTELYAQHYPAGSEGIKAGSAPASGFTFEDNNSLYFFDRTPGYADQLNNLTGFNYLNMPRLTWLSNGEILGANIGASVRVPFSYKQIRRSVSGIPTPNSGLGQFPGLPGATPLSPYQEDLFGLDDIEVQPILLSWKLKQFDFSAGYSFWAPTGDYDKNNLIGFNLGQGYWTHSFMLGITWYPDVEKTWAISILNHYEINTSQYSSLVEVPVSASAPLGIASEDTTLGNIYTLEWAISKAVARGIEAGVTGYYQQQVTSTEGPTFFGPTWLSERVQVAGIGPEIDANIEKWGLAASLRYAYEFSAMDHPQGQLITLNVIKSF